MVESNPLKKTTFGGMIIKQRIMNLALKTLQVCLNSVSVGVEIQIQKSLQPEYQNRFLFFSSSVVMKKFLATSAKLPSQLLENTHPPCYVYHPVMFPIGIGV